MDELALLLGRDAAKDRAFFGSLGQRRLTLQRGGIDPVLGPGNARVGGHMADSLWVVARDDLDLHALLRKEAERLGRTRGCGSATAAAPKIPAVRGRAPRADPAVCRYILPAAARGGPGPAAESACRQAPRPAARQHVGRTDDVAPCAPKSLALYLYAVLNGMVRTAAHAVPPCPKRAVRARAVSLSGCPPA